MFYASGSPGKLREREKSVQCARVIYSVTGAGAERESAQSAAAGSEAERRPG